MQGDLLYLNFLVIVLNLSELSQALGELLYMQGDFTLAELSIGCPKSY